MVAKIKKKKSKQLSLSCFSFESSWLRESKELTALGYEERQGEIGPCADHRQRGCAQLSQDWYAPASLIFIFSKQRGAAETTESSFPCQGEQLSPALTALLGTACTMLSRSSWHWKCLKTPKPALGQIDGCALTTATHSFWEENTENTKPGLCSAWEGIRHTFKAWFWLSHHEGMDWKSSCNTRGFVTVWKAKGFDF